MRSSRIDATQGQHLGHPEYRAGFERGQFLASRDVTLPTGQQAAAWCQRQLSLYEEYHCLTVESPDAFFSGLLAGIQYPPLPWDRVVRQCRRRGWSVHETEKRIPHTREYVRAFNLLDDHGRVLLSLVGSIDIEIYLSEH